MTKSENFVLRNLRSMYSDGGDIWKLANRIKGTRRYANTPIHGRGGVKYDAIGKATAVADCLEDQFRPNDR